jgi:hypothetical protein
MVEGRHLPGRAGAGELPGHPVELAGVQRGIGVQAEEYQVAEVGRVPPPRHTEPFDLALPVAVGDVVVAEDGEQASASAQEGGKRTEDHVVEPIGVTIGIDVVSEEHQGVERALSARPHHDLGGAVNEPPLPAHVSHNPQAQKRRWLGLRRRKEVTGAGRADGEASEQATEASSEWPCALVRPAHGAQERPWDSHPSPLIRTES